MKKWGAVVVVVIFASAMMWKFSDHRSTAPSHINEPSYEDAGTQTQSSLIQAKTQDKPALNTQPKSGASFSAFRSLVEQSREQSKKCKEDFKLATEGLNELKSQDPNAVTTELTQRLGDLAKVSLYPMASQQALQMIENGVPSDWDGELMTGEIGQLGDCAHLEQYDVIKNLIEGSAQWNDALKQEVTKTAAVFLKKGMDGPLPLLVHLIRIDILSQLQTHGLIDFRFAGKIKDLQNESQALKAKLVEQGQRCAVRVDRDCWTGYPFEVANSKSIREHYRALVSEALPSDRL